MRVTISVGGKFHAFHLARELEVRGALERLITSYPVSRVDAEIPREKIRSLIGKELLERGWRKMPRPIRELWNPYYAGGELFDVRASREIRTSDLVVGWANQSLHTLRKAKLLGAKTIVERGSSHILFQDAILREEYERWGVPLKTAQLAHPKIIEKELQEYEEADFISVPSSFTKHTFLDAGVPREKMLHIPYGTDLALFRQSPKKDNVFRVIFAGGLSLRKGVPYLLQAFSELKLQNAELVLIGGMNPEMEPFFKKYAGTFRYAGKMRQQELATQYSQGSVFVLPSIEEGLALVLAEAMASGLPVIATTNTGAEDLVRSGHNGYVIPIRNLEALKDKLQYLYDHPEEARQMGEHAKARVAEGFTWHDYGDRVFAEYQKLLH